MRKQNAVAAEQPVTVETRQSNLRIPVEVWMRLKIYGLKKHTPLQTLVTQALVEFLNRRERREQERT